MTSQRQEQVAESIAHLAAEFLARESNQQSLITVTRANVSPDLKQSTVYFTVFPAEFEANVVKFANRQRQEFRAFLKRRAKFKFLPNVQFVIDSGEKSRQRLDDISHEM